MHNKLCLILFLLTTLTLSACSAAVDVPPTVTPATNVAPSTVPATVQTTAPVTEPRQPAFQIPGLSVDEVIRYFNEVCLDAEFINSGDPSRLQKWDTPIYYCTHGTPTETDLEVLQSFALWLNTIDGFPGIFETDNPLEANLDIHFCSQEELITLMGNQFHGTDGAVTFWYSDDRIYEAIICCRTDLSQELRNSVILEELYNSLGPVQDTALREDSIIYAGYSEPQALTEIDQLILRLLYHPKLHCGMDAAACAEVICQLYE